MVHDVRLPGAGGAKTVRVKAGGRHEGPSLETGGYYFELGPILRQARDMGLKVRLVAGESCANDALSRVAQNASKGMLVTVLTAFEAGRADRAITDAIKDDGKDATGPCVLSACSAVRLIVEAIRAAGAEDTDLAAKALRHGTFKARTAR
ncbi:hypothetical protein ACWGRF_22975 [Streptomyces zhihengii]